MQELGYLEETVLLLVMAMEGDAYGFSISEAYQAHSQKSISISAIHTVLSRLENKGLLQSEMGHATAERGGRRKRLFEPTAEGHTVVAALQAARQKLWAQIPPLS